MKYFFDNCISPRFANMLSALGVDATALRDEFSQDIKDVPLFEKLKGRDVVYITSDAHQRTREEEARALKEAGVTALFLGPFWSKKKFWDQAIWIVRRWQTVEGFANGVTHGTCAEIKENGTAMVFVL